MKLTQLEIRKILDLAEPNEEIPIFAFYAARLGKVTNSDIEWAKQLNQ